MSRKTHFSFQRATTAREKRLFHRALFIRIPGPVLTIITSNNRTEEMCDDAKDVTLSLSLSHINTHTHTQSLELSHRKGKVKIRRENKEENRGGIKTK